MENNREKDAEVLKQMYEEALMSVDITDRVKDSMKFCFSLLLNRIVRYKD